MGKFDDKVMRDFEKYLALQKSGEINMVSSEVQKRLGITKEEHRFIMNNYSDIKSEYDKLFVVDKLIADAKKRVDGIGEPEKDMGFNKDAPES